MTAPKLPFTPSAIVLATLTGTKAQNVEWLTEDIDYTNENSWPPDRRARVKISLAVSTAVDIEITRDSGTTWTKLTSSTLTAELETEFYIQLAKTDQFNLRTPTVGGCTIRYCYIDLLPDER